MSAIQRIKDEIKHHEDSLEELRIELIMKLVLKEYNAAKEWDVCKEYNAAEEWDVCFGMDNNLEWDV